MVWCIMKWTENSHFTFRDQRKLFRLRTHKELWRRKMCINIHYLYLLHGNTLKNRPVRTRCLNVFIMHLFWVLLLYTVVTTTGQISLVFHTCLPKLRHLSRRGTSCRVLCRSCVTTRLVTTISTWPLSSKLWLQPCRFRSGNRWRSLGARSGFYAGYSKML